MNNLFFKSISNNFNGLFSSVLPNFLGNHYNRYIPYRIFMCVIVFILLLCDRQRCKDNALTGIDLSTPRSSFTGVMLYMLKGDTGAIHQITTERFYAFNVIRSPGCKKSCQMIGDIWKSNIDNIQWGEINTNQKEYRAYP